MKKKQSLFYVMLFAAVLVSSCSYQESDGLKQSGTYEINFVPAKTNAELKVLTENPANNLVRSVEQYDELMANRLTPLSNLPQNVQEDFRNGLVFSNNGIASIRYGVVKKMLTETQYHEVMSVFGIDSKDGFWGGASTNARSTTDAAEDYKGYWCESRKSCKKDENSICTTNC